MKPQVGKEERFKLEEELKEARMQLERERAKGRADERAMYGVAEERDRAKDEVKPAPTP